MHTKVDVKVVDFLNREYREYSKYVLYNRAIPMLIDGFKPVQRKLLYTALKHCKTSFIKTLGMTGYTMAESHYSHGDASIIAAINLLTQDFAGSNNIPMFQGSVPFGNRLAEVPPAARYTQVKLNSEFFHYFNDFDILDQNDDIENPEPKTYLPIIPWVLVNGVRGIAIGFATDILPRDPKLLKKIVKEKLLHGKNFQKKDYPPYFKGFTGTIAYDSEWHNWIIKGRFERVSKKHIRILELPIDFNQEKYVVHLNKLMEKRIITDYEDHSKTSFDFHVKLHNDLPDNKIEEYFKLISRMSENLTVIDNEGRLREFSNPDDLVNYFVEYRIKKYAERLDRETKLAENEIKLIEEKKRFIKNVVDGVIKLDILTKKDLISLLGNNKFTFVQELINMKIFNFTLDEIEDLNIRKKALDTQLVGLATMTAKDAWLGDLK